MQVTPFYAGNGLAQPVRRTVLATQFNPSSFGHNYEKDKQVTGALQTIAGVTMAASLVAAAGAVVVGANHLLNSETSPPESSQSQPK
jgi:hypothetical protein